MAGREREFHRRGLAIWIRLRLVEVCVPIDEQQAEPTAPLQCECRAQQNRAVAAKNQRELATIQYMSDRIGQLRTPRRNRCCVENQRRSVTFTGAVGGGHTARMPG